jgi:hypothetical protein
MASEKKAKAKAKYQPSFKSVERDGKRVRYTLEETRQHTLDIEQLLPHSQVSAIVRAMRAKYGVSRMRVERIAREIKDRWVREDEASGALQENRAAAIRRIDGYLALARGRRDPQNPAAWVEKPNHGALARYETLKANLQGTFAPLKVDVEYRVSASIQHVVANLTAEQVAGYLAKQREMRELAERAKLLLPPGEAEVLPARKAGA